MKGAEQGSDPDGMRQGRSLSVQAHTFAGLSAAIDHFTGVGGIHLPDPLTDVVDPEPTTALSMHEATLSEAVREMRAHGITPSLEGGWDWTWLDEGQTVLSLECEPIHDTHTLADIAVSVGAVLEALGVEV